MVGLGRLLQQMMHMQNQGQKSQQQMIHVIPSGLPWVSWAAKISEAIEKGNIDHEFGESSDEIKQLIFDRTQGTAWDIASGGGEAHGLESYRLIKRRDEPRTEKQLICIRSATRVDEVEQKARHMEELIKRCETMSGTSLPEGFKVTVITDPCSKEF